MARLLKLCMASAFAASLFTVLPGPFAAKAHAAEICADTPEGRVCSIGQSIIGGAAVGRDEEKRLGLVTINGGCSGTLLRERWVLTARHCVTTDGKMGGPLATPSQIGITATWADGNPRATEFRELKPNITSPGSQDIILVHFGSGAFGPVNRQNLYGNLVDTRPPGSWSGKRLTTSDSVRQYGRGFSDAATGVAGTPSEKLASQSGVYRSAQFKPSDITETRYTLVMNSAGQAGAGGDSGGPTFLLRNGAPAAITGVQSTCTASGFIPNAPSPPAGSTNPGWKYATGIEACQYVSVEPYVREIGLALREPIGTNADLNGTWVLKTVQNAEYQLMLRVDDGDKVVGRYQNTSASVYDGTLTGTAKDGRLRFNWVTDATGETGTGVLSVYSDNTLDGGITVPRPGDKPIYYGWFATLKARPVAPVEPAGDPSGFVGLWGGQNSIWGSFQLNLTAGENGAVQGPISGAATGFVQGRVRADGRTYVFTFNSSHLGTTGSGALVLSADGKSLSGDTVSSSAVTRIATGGKWYAARIDTAQAGATPPRPADPGQAARRASAIADVDMYIGPSGDTPVLGIWRKDARAVPLQSQDGWCKLQGINDGQDAWVWGEFVSGCN